MIDNKKIKSEPLISIIIPVFNAEKYLEECLDSVLNQTFRDFEVICVNDGSLDNSRKILEKYVQSDSRIKIINQKNSGTVVSRNNAINIAQGKYIYPLDSDDKIAPTCLEKLLNVIMTTDYAVVTSDVELFGIKSGKFNIPPPTKFNMYSYNNGCTNSALYEKKYWVKYKGYDVKFNRGLEDFDLYLNFLDDGKKIYRFPEILFFYRQKNIEESRNLRARYHKDLGKLLRQKHPKMIFYSILRFLYQNRITKSKKRIIKIIKIPVWWKKITD